MAGAIGRRWGQAMSDDAIAACREDAASGNRDQLARDVLDLLDEIDQLRFNLTCMAELARPEWMRN